jgi:hypothetical protein
MNSNNDQIFINRLNQHPELRKRMESLLNVVENAAGDCTKADDAERHVIEDLRLWAMMRYILGPIRPR